MSRRYPRSAWTDTLSRAVPLDRTAVRGLAVHWTGTPVPQPVYDGGLEAVRQHLDAVRQYHVATKGWADIAYNEAVDTAGRRWELRGWLRRSAANDGAANGTYCAVVALLGQGQTVTPAMRLGLQAAVSDFRGVYPGATLLRGHRDVDPGGTLCPGDQLARLLKAGDLDPRPIIVRTPTPPTIEELLEMDLQDRISIPASYDSNTHTDGTPEIITVETLLRRVYDWTWKAAHKPPAHQPL